MWPTSVNFSSDVPGGEKAPTRSSQPRASCIEDGLGVVCGSTCAVFFSIEFCPPTFPKVRNQRLATNQGGGSWELGILKLRFQACPPIFENDWDDLVTRAQISGFDKNFRDYGRSLYWFF